MDSTGDLVRLAMLAGGIVGFGFGWLTSLIVGDIIDRIHNRGKINRRWP